MEERQESAVEDIWPLWLVGFVMLIVRAAALDVLMSGDPPDVRLAP